MATWKYAVAGAGGLAVGLAVWWFFPRVPREGRAAEPPGPPRPSARGQLPRAPGRLAPPPGVTPPPPALPVLGPVPDPSGELPPLPPGGFVPPAPPRPKRAGPHGK
jgi:hypothetical protein